MKTVNSWNYTPYTQLHKPERGLSPYICRIAPFECGFSCDFFDNGNPQSEHSVYWREIGTDEWEKKFVGKEKNIQIENLKNCCDYEFYIVRENICEEKDGYINTKKSSVRIVRTGAVDGVVVNYLNKNDKEYAFSGNFLCSPSLVRLDDGTLLASMDVFEGQAPQNLTLIYRSSDNGNTWDYLTELFPCFWGKLFIHRGGLYMLSASTEYGDLLIGRSYDGGKNWTVPTVLMRGACHFGQIGCHRAPMPITEYRGRLWTDFQCGCWGQKTMDNSVLSVSVDDDLLIAENWIATDVWRHEEFKTTADSKDYIEGIVGGIEGNVVEYNGKLYDFLRYGHCKWLLLEINSDNPEAKPEFNSLIDFSATMSKLDIQKDHKTGMYYTICSRFDEKANTARNLLSLARSKDLRNWEFVRDIIDYRYSDPSVVGFQYVSFLIEEDDIIFLSRTAWNEPRNSHDSNYITFHRIKDFREKKVSNNE